MVAPAMASNRASSRKAWLAAAAILACVDTAAGACASWSFWWGDNCANCTLPSTYDIVNHSMTQTGNGCNTPACESWTQGAFPTLRKLANGSIVPDVNNGVPQRANLTLHKELLQAQVVKWLPDPDYSGNAVFGEPDLEGCSWQRSSLIRGQEPMVPSCRHLQRPLC